MSKFKVGDKVRVIDGGCHLNTDNDFIKQFDPNLLDKWRNGKYYGTFGRTQDVVGTVIAVGEIDKVLVSDAIGELFVIYEYGLSLEPIRREFIVIRRSGAETIAELRHDREVIKSAVATCSEKDAFDFETGAKIAFDKLTGRYVKPAKEPKPAPQPTHRFKVGDRVVTPIGTGIVIRDDKSDVPYCIAYKDHPRFGNFNAWSRECDTSPAPEPPKFYTGKVKLAKSCGCYECEHIVGEEFVISNGYVISDRGAWGQPFSSFSDFVAKRHNKNWVEVKSDV